MNDHEPPALMCPPGVGLFAALQEPQAAMKYILVTGGVISGIGKGVIASSLGTILKGCGMRVTSIKIDPYINIDAGTFSPYEHGKQWWFTIENVHSCFCIEARSAKLFTHCCWGICQISELSYYSKHLSQSFWISWDLMVR